MINILKEGDGDVVRTFRCKRCGCEFETDQYDIDELPLSYYFSSRCPYCHLSISIIDRKENLKHGD